MTETLKWVKEISKEKVEKIAKALRALRKKPCPEICRE